MMEWYVARSHVHAESKALANLMRQGYEAYLPLCRRWVTHARRREVAQRPLFPGYLFVRFDIGHTRWRSIMSTIGVARLICHGDLPARVVDGVVEAIKTAEEDGLFDYTHAVSQLKPGDKVRVASGPFANLIGQFQSTVSNDRIRVLLEILGRYAPTDLALSEVEALRVDRGSR
jgi:transcriptional antiterminator RfaH